MIGFFAKIRSKFQGFATGVTCFSLFICLLSTLPARAETDLILAEIGEDKITLRDLENKILRIQGKTGESSNLDKEAVLLEMVRLEVFAKESLAHGLENDKEVETRIMGLQDNIAAKEENLQKDDKEGKDRMRVAKNYVLATEYLKKEVNDKIQIDDESVLQYFNNNRNKYMVPEKIRARQIFIAVNTETETDTAKEKAERVSKRLKDGDDFNTLAMEFSEDSLSKDLGGDLGYFSRGRLVPELEVPVFQLKKGEISPVLKSWGGFHIFKLEDRIESRPMEYPEAREQIMKTLKDEKGNELYKALEEKLFKKYEVRIYKDRIPPTPPSLPNTN